MKSIILIPSLIFLGFFISCKKNCTTNAKCGWKYAPLTIEYLGYDKSEIDTIIIKEYYPDGSFSHLINSTLYDTRVLTEPGPAEPLYSIDKVEPIDSFHSYGISCVIINHDNPYEANDVEIYIPATNRTYSLYNVQIGGEDEKKVVGTCNDNSGNLICERTVNGYTIDGKKVTGNLTYRSVALQK